MPIPETTSSIRRSTASAIAPPQSPNTTSGTRPNRPVRPTQEDEPVIWNSWKGTATTVSCAPTTVTTPRGPEPPERGGAQRGGVGEQAPSCPPPVASRASSRSFAHPRIVGNPTGTVRVSLASTDPVRGPAARPPSRRCAGRPEAEPVVQARRSGPARTRRGWARSASRPSAAAAGSARRRRSGPPSRRTGRRGRAGRAPSPTAARPTPRSATSGAGCASTRRSPPCRAARRSR